MLATIKKNKETFIAFFCIFCFAVYQSFFGSDISSDGDVYAHLMRFKQFWDTGSFKEIPFPLTNTPFGEVWHYTRLFDLVVLAAVYPLTLFADFGTVFPIVSKVLPPVFYLLSAGMLFYGLKPYAKSFILVALSMTLTPFIFAACRYGNFDHHFLEVFLTFSTIAFVLRYFHKPTDFFLRMAAICLAAVLWVGVEGLFLYFCFMGFFFLTYLLKREKIQMLLRFQGIYTLSIFAFLFINPPQEGFYFIDLGRLSFFHLAFNVFTFNALFLLSRLPQKTVFKCLVPAVFAAAFAVLFREALSFKLMSPELYERWYWMLGDVQSLFIFSFFSLFFYVSVFFFCWDAFPTKKNAFALLLFGMAVYWAMALFHARFAVFLSCFCAFAIPLCVTKKASRIYLATLIFFVFIFPYLAPAFLYNPNRGGGGEVFSARPEALLPYLEKGADKGVFLSSPDYAMFFVYHTGRPTVAWNFYRNESGLLYYYRLIDSSNKTYVKDLLAERKIKTIIFPVKRVTSDYDKYSMYFRMQQGEFPDFIKPVPLPLPLSNFWRVYTIEDKDASKTIN